jgi:hypothetical protein
VADDPPLTEAEYAVWAASKGRQMAEGLTAALPDWMREAGLPDWMREAALPDWMREAGLRFEWETGGSAGGERVAPVAHGASGGQLGSRASRSAAPPEVSR